MNEFDSQSQSNGAGYQHDGDEDEENSPKINKGPRSASVGAKSNHNDSSSHGILFQDDQDR